MASGFSSFVAWRYLLARPRQLSASILGFTAIATWVAVHGALAAHLYPLAHPYLLGPPIPIQLALAVALGLSAVPVGALAGVLWPLLFTERRRVEPGFLHIVALGVLVAGAGLGLHAGAVAAGGFDQFLADAPVARAVLLVPGALSLAALLAAALGVFASGGAGPGTRALYALFWGFAVLLLLPLAALGLRDAVIPELWEQAPAVLVGSGAIAAGLSLAAAALGLRQIAGAGSARGWRVLALGALVAVGAAIGAAWILIGAEGWRDARGFGLRQAPMWMTMTATIAGALAALSLVLVLVRYVFTFFTTVSIGGVSIGAMALVIVLSVMSGFETDLRDKILGSNAHILVTKKDDGPFTEYAAVAEALSDVPSVVAHTPYLETEVVISARNNYANVIIKGIDPDSVAEVTDVDDNTEDPEALAKLWPLADDGTVAGPPPDRRRGPTRAEAGDAPRPGGEPAVDPAPEDLAVDIDEPFDFSSPEPEPEPEPEPGEDRDDVVDPAPGDVHVDPDAPMDLSGGERRGDGGERGVPSADRSADEGALPDDDGALGVSPFPGSGPGWDPLDPLSDDVSGGPPGGLDLEALGDPRSIAPEVARLPGVLVGRELVKQVSMHEGDEVTVVSPLGQDSPVGPIPRTKRYRVAGEFFTGMYEYDLKYVYVTLASLQDFLDLGDEVSGIEVRIENPDRTGAVLPRIADAIGDVYAVTDWRELNRSLFSALKLEKIAMFLVLAIIILVASFSIIGNLVMIVIEKSKEIATLKTLGASDGGVMKVFVVQGFFIGLVGTLLGVCLGLVVCALGIHYGLPLDPDVYYIDQLPIHVEPVSVGLVAMAGILISVVATLYPAYVAARLRPVEGLRYE